MCLAAFEEFVSERKCSKYFNLSYGKGNHSAFLPRTWNTWNENTLDDANVIQYTYIFLLYVEEILNKPWGRPRTWWLFVDPNYPIEMIQGFRVSENSVWSKAGIGFVE